MTYEDQWSSYTPTEDNPWEFEFDQELQIIHKRNPTTAIIVGRFISSMGKRFYVAEFTDCETKQIVFLVRTANKLRKMIAP